MSGSSRRPENALIIGIKRASVTLAGAAVVAMAVIMLAEAVMRYVFTDPLGWNISAVERILMPMSVFLALPWLYVTAGHVSAEIVYDRLPAPWQMTSRIIGHLLLLVTAAALVWGGMVTVVDSFVLGDAPPPGSSEVPIPSWIWELSQPVGAAALFLVALLDSRRAVIEDGALEDTEGDEEALIAATAENIDDGGDQS
ncbi:TRAP transporter small permease [Brevibacterium oceani]|uniref:TRAP transporter small permease n=1 Tax=Brevibacterium oceani TaxID=358099 RepID=UPI0015E7811A|nr:TRAP transporter small permease [Brevibacterium oceani]